MEKPIYRVVCPCCASTLFDLETKSSRIIAHNFISFGKPLVWTCSYCSFSMMGLAIPIRFSEKEHRFISESHVMKTLGAIEEMIGDK